LQVVEAEAKEQTQAEVVLEDFVQLLQQLAAEAH
jgi:hypothetical protein